jgi:hypothetical protein
MKNRFAVLVAPAATALMLLGACSEDDGPRILARGEDIDFVGHDELGDQTMDLSAQQEDAEVTGQVSFEPHGSVVSLQCADTESHGVVGLGGQFTTVPDDGDEALEQVPDDIPDDAFYEVEDGDDIETG